MVDTPGRDPVEQLWRLMVMAEYGNLRIFPDGNSSRSSKQQPAATTAAMRELHNQVACGVARGKKAKARGQKAKYCT
ncbi:hypothetical protein B7463_g10717, partial [Scytalidium lignicola]